MKHDFAHVLKYYSGDALDSLIEKNVAWKGVKEDIQAIEDAFDIKAGPTNEEEKEHAKLANDLVRIDDQEVREILIEKMGRLRHFLG